MKYLLLATLLLVACADQDQTTTFHSADYRGQWVVINYWAEWCKPCIKEIPELNGLDRREGYRVLGANFDC